jgi:hypothetical protein
MAAAAAGWKGYDDWDDPADLLARLEEETAAELAGPAERYSDPELRAAQVAAFLAAVRG